jgi:hypothetical protein
VPVNLKRDLADVQQYFHHLFTLLQFYPTASGVPISSVGLLALPGFSIGVWRGCFLLDSALSHFTTLFEAERGK